MLSKRKSYFSNLRGEYLKDKSDVTFYNLPKKVEFCKTCTISNQKPIQTIEHTQNSSENIIESDKKITLEFKDGICYACRHKSQKKDVDWKKKEFEFRKLLDKYRSRNGSYDIVIPGSGGKDSFKVAHELKYKYGMNPITCTFAPCIYTDTGKNNLINWINTGFSNYNFTMDGKIHRLFTRLCIDHLLHPFQTWIMGQKAFPNKFAKMMKIPLVIYGENPREYDQGTKSAFYDENVIRELHTRDKNDELFIAGIPLEKLKKDLGLSDAEVEPYIPMTTEDYDKEGIKCITYSYYHDWHQQGNYYYVRDNSEDFKLSEQRSAGTYSRYSSLDDKIDDLYYYTTFVKFGIGRAQYDACHEVRAGDINIEEAKALIKKYTGEYPTRFMRDICKWLSIKKDDFKNLDKFLDQPEFTEEYFSDLCETFKSPHLFKKTNEKKLQIRYLP